MGWLAQPALDLLSALPPAECAHRLSDAIDRPALFGGGSRPVIGTMDGNRLTARKRIGYRNDMQHRLTATLAAEGRGTRIRGRFGMAPVVTVFLAAWCAVLGSASLAVAPGLITGLIQGHPPGGDWLPGLIPILMFAVGILLFAIGRVTSVGESRYLTAFVAEVCQARPAS